MSCFEKLTHVLWHCQFHIVWYTMMKNEGSSTFHMDFSMEPAGLAIM